MTRTREHRGEALLDRRSEARLVAEAAIRVGDRGSEALQARARTAFSLTSPPPSRTLGKMEGTAPSLSVTARDGVALADATAA